MRILYLHYSLYIQYIRPVLKALAQRNRWLLIMLVCLISIRRKKRALCVAIKLIVTCVLTKKNNNTLDEKKLKAQVRRQGVQTL